MAGRQSEELTMRKFGLVAISEGCPLLGIFDENHEIWEFVEISDPTGHYKDFEIDDTEVVEIEGDADPVNTDEGFTLVSHARYSVSRDEDGIIPVNFFDGIFMDLLEDEEKLHEYFNTIWNETVVEVLKYGEILKNPLN